MYIVRSNGYSYTEDRGIRRTIDGKDAFCLQAGLRQLRRTRMPEAAI